MSEMKKIGEMVARVRRQQGFTQLELMQAADVGRRFVVELEAGANGYGTLKSIIDGSMSDVVYYAVSRRSRQNENTASCNNNSHRRNDNGTH